METSKFDSSIYSSTYFCKWSISYYFQYLQIINATNTLISIIHRGYKVNGTLTFEITVTDEKELIKVTVGK